LKDGVYRLLYRAIRGLFLRTRVLGLENLPKSGPAVLVANHTGSYGPISVMSSLPRRLYPWVVHQIMDPRLCGDYLRRDFTERELGLRPPWSIFLSRLIAAACVALMRGIEAIPVYRHSRRIGETFDASLRRLREGKMLVVFPEDPDRRTAGGVSPFSNGFLRLGRLYAAAGSRPFCFTPVAVSRRSRTLRVGPPVCLDPRRPFGEERLRVRARLEAVIGAMVLELEDSALAAAARA
jgi:hypothetical protein